MAIHFTPEQQEVISLHGCNLLVSAAAGSGKTAVLTQRIVQMICRKENPVDIDRLLVVTFTNAAAAEMRERIGAAVAARLEEEPENAHIQRQATLIHNAQITTIDSFCLFVLRNNFNDIGLDPAFRVAEEGEIELLRQEVLGQLLEDRFAEGKEDFHHCVEVYCPNGRESALEEHILNLHDFAMSQPWPEEWLEQRKADYQIRDGADMEGQDWAVFLKEHLHRMLSGCVEQMERVNRLCMQPAGPYMYGETVEQEKEQIEKLLRMDSLSQLEAALPAVSFGRLSSKKDESVDPQLRELAKKLRNGVKDSLKEMQEQYFVTPMALAVEQMQECGRAVETLADLCLEFGRRMEEAKREKNLLDFSDMEHMALRILLEKTQEGVTPTRTAMEYREYFQEVLIDEYQDSNLVQEYILKAVSGEEDGNFNRFMVGDVKQSIYKFRLARPELFLEKYHDYESSGSQDCRRIDLHRNFRSRPEVIRTVNEVFGRIMTRQVGGIVYDDRAALHEGAVYPASQGCESELILMEKPEKGEELSPRALEALGITRKIRQLRREFQVTDKETGLLRPLQYRDIVVLLRTNSGWDEEFREVFEREGIPVYISSRTGYFATNEIQTVLQFLRVLDNPLQDVPLFGVLKSVFGGFTDEEIALVRRHVQETAETAAGQAETSDLAADGEAEAAEVTNGQERRLLYEDLEWCASREGHSMEEKCAAFLKMIQRYRRYTIYMPIRKLLQTLFDETCYLHYVAALPAGEQRLANVEMLLEKARAFEKTSYYGLYHFIRYMEQLQKYNVDYGEANILDENADVVRIMSIHKSKGLEFPVTFVAGLSKRFNMQDTGQAMIVDMDLGIGTDYVNPDRRLKNRTLRKKALAAKMRRENLAEEIRVLYVAMTRAKEKLILTGVLENAAERAQEAEMENRLRRDPGQGGEIPDAEAEPLSYAALYRAASCMDLLLQICRPTCIWTGEDLAAEEIRESIGEEERRNLLRCGETYVDQKLLQKLQERFAYTYPHADLANLYTKTTVSELKIAALEEAEEGAFHAFQEAEVVPYIPRFMQAEEKISGAARGSAFHRVMELLDLSSWPGFRADDTAEGRSLREEWMRRELDRMQQSGKLTEEYRKAVSGEKIFRFMDSSLAGRMAAAEKAGLLWREQPFVYGISADRLGTPGGGKFPSEETVLIQGIVDVFFEERGELVVADYKTDVIRTPEELARRYKVQLDYYEEALEHLTGRRVKERILYSFYLGCEIPV
ncbi:MAG: helicase-exonuclease AddAB subunit AddA [Lachnospiraceae bacterium]|nr:helicase-exonuclease AddAB subunit AddA [Lachnospiraceae bacterium]